MFNVFDGDDELGAAVLEALIECLEIVFIDFFKFIMEFFFKSISDGFVNLGGVEDKGNAGKKEGLLALFVHSKELEGFGVKLFIFQPAGEHKFKELDAFSVSFIHQICKTSVIE